MAKGGIMTYINKSIKNNTVTGKKSDTKVKQIHTHKPGDSYRIIISR